MAQKPNMNSESEKELAKVEKQFDAYKESIDELTLDRMNMAPKKEVEPQAKLSQQDIAKANDIYLKPFKTISGRDKFNEAFRKDYEFEKEYVQFVAQNNEIIGENIELWTKPFSGIPAEFWKVPVGKAVYGPRYLAERIKGSTYHRLSMQQNNVTSSDGMGQYYGSMTVDTTIQRLDALPVSGKKSVFMNASGF